MKLARELWELAMSRMATNAEGYAKKVVRRARWAAYQSKMSVQVSLPIKARHVQKEISNALYEEGFTVYCQYFPKTSSFYVNLDWSEEVPKPPRYTDYSGY